MIINRPEGGGAPLTLLRPGGGFCPRRLWTLITFLIFKANATRLSDFLKKIIWEQFDMTCHVLVSWRFQGNNILTSMFYKISISLIKNIKEKLSCSIFEVFRSFYYVFIRFNYFWADFGSFFEVLDKSRNPRWRTKIAAIQKWLCNYYVMWRHHLMMRTSKETFSDVLSTLKVSLW